MIPKKIHYIWLGGKPLPKMVKKCMKTWSKCCPDYEIVRWDETNLNLDINTYCRQAYDSKKYAFASDVLRFEILKNEGGIYLDVDVELFKSLDNLLDCKAFTGLEMGDHLSIAPGLIFGSEKNGEFVSAILEKYNNDVFVRENGEINLETVCQKTTNYIVDKYNFELTNEIHKLDEIILYPTEYFCPLNAVTKEADYLTENTYSQHLYLASWVKKPNIFKRIKIWFKKFVKFILGKKNYEKLKGKIKGENNGK